jgi:hypothetical protein
MAASIDYRLKPLLQFFGTKQIRDINTVAVERFIAELRKPRRVNYQPNRVLSPA